jgi:hypothetical protein
MTIRQPEAIWGKKPRSAARIRRLTRLRTTDRLLTLVLMEMPMLVGVAWAAPEYRNARRVRWDECRRNPA